MRRDCKTLLIWLPFRYSPLMKLVVHFGDVKRKRKEFNNFTGMFEREFGNTPSVKRNETVNPPSSRHSPLAPFDSNDSHKLRYSLHHAKAASLGPPPFPNDTRSNCIKAPTRDSTCHSESPQSPTQHSTTANERDSSSRRSSERRPSGGNSSATPRKRSLATPKEGGDPRENSPESRWTLRRGSPMDCRSASDRQRCTSSATVWLRRWPAGAQRDALWRKVSLLSPAFVVQQRFIVALTKGRSVSSIRRNVSSVVLWKSFWRVFLHPKCYFSCENQTKDA